MKIFGLIYILYICYQTFHAIRKLDIFTETVVFYNATLVKTSYKVKTKYVVPKATVYGSENQDTKASLNDIANYTPPSSSTNFTTNHPQSK